MTSIFPSLFKETENVKSEEEIPKDYDPHRNRDTLVTTR